MSGASPGAPCLASAAPASASPASADGSDIFLELGVDKLYDGPPPNAADMGKGVPRQAAQHLPASLGGSDIMHEAVAFKTSPGENPSVVEELLKENPLQCRVLQSRMFSHGVEDDPHLRPLLWKLLLRYLPWTPERWSGELLKRRSEYAQFVQELIVNPYAQMDKDKADDEGSWTKVSALDDPLSAQSDEWNEFYSDQELRSEIRKDVKRTYSTFSFFQQRVTPKVERDAAKFRHQKKKVEEQNLFKRKKKPTKKYILSPPSEKDDETHHDVLSRILFIYAKLNPGIKYVQGMNEILAPIYFVFARDEAPMFKGQGEADAFFCFTRVMSEVRDRFIKSLDDSENGILAAVKQLNSLLNLVDYQLWHHLEQLGVNPQYYSFRWLTLLLSQEFELPDVIRLWDTLFADKLRWSFLNYTCTAMLVCIRDRLLSGDFAAVLQDLQQYPVPDIQLVISVANELRQKFPPSSIVAAIVLPQVGQRTGSGRAAGPAGTVGHGRPGNASPLRASAQGETRRRGTGSEGGEGSGGRGQFPSAGVNTEMLARKWHAGKAKASRSLSQIARKLQTKAANK